MTADKKAARQNRSKLIELLQQHVPQAIALLGDSSYEKERCLQVVLDAAARDRASITSFDAEQTGNDLGPLFNDLMAAPLFGGKRLVVMRRADELLKKVRPLLQKFLARPSRNSIVFELKSLDKDAELERALAERGAIIACDKPSRRFGSEAMLEWLAQEAHQRGLKTEPAALPLLLDLVGDDQARLADELAKLALATANVKPVSVDLVHKLAAPSAMKSVDELLRAAFRGRTQDALKVLDVILREGMLHWSGRSIRGEDNVTVPFLFWVHDRLRKIAAVHEARAAGEREVRDALSIRSDPQWRMLQSEARQVSEARARAGLLALYRADDALRDGAAGRSVLTELVIALSAGAEQTARAGS
ncbi:MAG: hypothetical protein U1E76_11980 [Planctomycetota bacterium]